MNAGTVGMTLHDACVRSMAGASNESKDHACRLSRYTIASKVLHHERSEKETMGSGLASKPAWLPSPFLQQVLSQKKEWVEGYRESGGVAVDLGSGAGRDAVYMCLTLGDKWKVIACDNHEGDVRIM
jgi:hypothetical protein